MKRNQIEEALRELGYEIEYRKDGWKECLVAGNGEAWVGSGLTGDAALRSAVGKMFPSSGAAALLEKSATAVALDVPKRREAPVAEPVSSETGDSSGTRRRRVVPKPVPPASPEPPTSVSEPSGVRTRTYVDPRIEAEEAPSVTTSEGDEVSETKEEALKRLAEILEEIEDEADDVMVMTTLNQRFNVAHWMFQARVLEEEHPRDEEVTETVHQVALCLTGLCKLAWPGSVRALQLWARPSHALEGLAHPPVAPQTWAAASFVMEHELERLAERPAHDEYGWRDRAELLPEPADPSAVLDEAVEKMENVLGPLAGSPDEKKDKLKEEEVLEQLEDLVLAAHLLRWVRRCCPDRKRWGLAMGTLRWTAKEYRPATEPLQEVIDDDYRPSSSWAELLGRDPKVNEQNRLRREIKRHPPEKTWPEEDLLDWLQRAFRVFANPQIAKMAASVQDAILNLTNEDFADADRTTRTRLRKLQAIFRVGEDVSDVRLPTDEELANGNGTEPSQPKPVADPATVLLGKVRPLVQGKRMLFVSNRDDEELRARLEEDLGCKVTLKNGSSTRQMGVIVDGVTPERYDFVVMATGFNRHHADTNLCRAAKAAGVPYLRVNKGRPLATVRALARLLNVKISDDESASVASSA